MDEPSKVIRDRIHFSLLRAVISPEIFRFPFDKTDAKPKGVGLRSLALSCLSWSLHVFCFKFSSSTFVIFLSHGWPLQWQPWCLVLWHSSEMRINKDGSGYKTWCQRLSSKRKKYLWSWISSESPPWQLLFTERPNYSSFSFRRISVVSEFVAGLMKLWGPLNFMTMKERKSLIMMKKWILRLSILTKTF